MASQFTNAFKQETLCYMQDNPHKTRKQIADELDITHGTSKRWYPIFKDSGVLTESLSAKPTTNKAIFN